MKRVLMLMSDTGGGHRAAAEAVAEALRRLYGADALAIDIVDVFRGYSHFPARQFPEIYGWLVNNVKSLYGMGYKIANTRAYSGLIARSMYSGHRKNYRRLFEEHPADVVVNFHSMTVRPTLSALYGLAQRPPFLTVVTDLVTTPVFWYDERADFCYVPTPEAYTRGVALGMPAEKMRVTGLPVHPRFADSLTDKLAARRELGWDEQLPAVLMVSGGDGMGPVYSTARAINRLKRDCQLVIVAGRNAALKKRLDGASWNQKTIVYPFVTNMPRLMAAADVLVTKAGPATICEACIAGLPMILSDAIPGQEEGNVTFVVNGGAGVFAPSPKRVARAVADWLGRGADGLHTLSENARALAHADAVYDIAREVWRYAQMPPVENPRRRDKKPRLKIKNMRG